MASSAFMMNMLVQKLRAQHTGVSLSMILHANYIELQLHRVYFRL